MARWTAVVMTCMLALAGCGSGDEPERAEEPGRAEAGPVATTPAETAPQPDPAPAREPSKPTGTRIVLGESEFGSMLFDSKRQAIYVFENDSDGTSNCYGECAAAWPPVFTRGEPVAARGIDRSLLGTTRRRDGRLQVTYGGKPLYFYAHEAPGEVRCHNVDLNGGFWWVIGPDGNRRA